MKLSSISVSRFRSILEATRIELEDLTVLIGKNNEGKSNFLRALELSFLVVKDLAYRSRVPNTIRPRFREYDWNRDFPLAYMHRHSGRKDTTFRLAFELTDNEVDEFHSQFDVSINSNLSVEIVLNENSSPRMRWAKQGQSAGKIDSRMSELAEFIENRFTFVYIPSIRTEHESSQIIANLVNQQLVMASRRPEYLEALEHLRQLESPIFEKLSDDVIGTLKQFLPGISSIRFERPVDNLGPARTRRVSILLNDGHETDLALKGDGVKSIVALALFKHGAPAVGSSMLAIEEPEAHLHAGAIHELRQVLRQISNNSQVIISTHSHAFVSREKPSRNMIVDGGKVREARNVAEIRKLIGVRASDNLLHADLVVVVEGRDDEISLRRILEFKSTVLAEAIHSGTISFDVLGGAGRLAHKAGTLRRELFSFHVILDGDQAGEGAIKDALDAHCLEGPDYNLIKVPGLHESELEDIIDPRVYADALYRKYGISISRNSIPGRAKWVSRIRELFSQQGKLWDDTIKTDVKYAVAEAVAHYQGDPISPHRGSIASTIVATLEQKLADLER